MTEPQVPPALTSDGVNLATYDAVVSILLVLNKHFPQIKEDICELLLQRFQQHQKLVDEHGTAANVNAAAALRLIMMQIECAEIPDHQ